MAGKATARAVDGSDDLEIEYKQPPDAPAPERVVAIEDLLIDRPDLGRGAQTFVLEGDDIPPAALPYLNKSAAKKAPRKSSRSTSRSSS